MRERPMRPPVGPTENMHSEYGPDVARSVPLSGASETVPIVYAADGIACRCGPCHVSEMLQRESRA